TLSTDWPASRAIPGRIIGHCAKNFPEVHVATPLAYWALPTALEILASRAAGSIPRTTTVHRRVDLACQPIRPSILIEASRTKDGELAVLPSKSFVTESVSLSVFAIRQSPVTGIPLALGRHHDSTPDCDHRSNRIAVRHAGNT